MAFTFRTLHHVKCAGDHQRDEGEDNDYIGCVHERTDIRFDHWITMPGSEVSGNQQRRNTNALVARNSRHSARSQIARQYKRHRVLTGDISVERGASSCALQLPGLRIKPSDCLKPFVLRKLGLLQSGLEHPDRVIIDLGWDRKA